MHCRITYRWASDRSLVGDFVQGDRTLNIGQTALCDIRIPENRSFEPEMLAIVLPCGDGRGWNVVKRSDFYEMRINGQKVELAAALNDGDELAFFCCNEKMAVLEFKRCPDDSTDGVVYGHRRFSTAAVWASSVIGVAAILLACIALTRNNSLLRYEDFSIYENSVFQIVTDSVFLVEARGDKEIVVEAEALDMAEKGTCFLTDEGLLVTARHCVEPWIDDDWSVTKETDALPQALRLAAKAETLNRELGEELYSVRSHCVVLYDDGPLEYNSSAFKINRSRDNIIDIGVSGNPVYIRSMIPLAGRRDMELGDFAYIETDRTGRISLASVEDMRLWENGTERDVMVMGYPLNDNRTDSINTVERMCQKLEWNEDGDALKGCIHIAGGITKGYSGGPVFIRLKEAGEGRLKVIGLVSKYDATAQNSSFWVVPAYEVLELRSQGGEICDDTFMYRR